MNKNANDNVLQSIIDKKETVYLKPELIAEDISIFIEQGMW